MKFLFPIPFKMYSSRIIRIFILGIPLCAFVSYFSFGQELADKGKRIQPKLNKIYVEGVMEKDADNYVLDGPFMAASSNAIWVAVAARADVPVYTQANESSQKKEEKLPLFSQYMVYRLLGSSKAYKDAWLDIIEYNNFAVNKDLVLERPLKRLGYVKASDMLIWDRALRDEANQYIKILAVHDMKSLQNFTEQAKEFSSNLQLFDSPDMANPLPNPVPLLDFLFVYKTVINSKGNKVFLLGRTESLEKGAELCLLGWAPEGLLKRWPGRLVLEPNTEAKAVQQRSKNNFKYKIAFEPGGYEQKPLEIEDPKGVRWPPLTKRLPIFKDQSTKDEYKVSYITNGEGSSKSATDEEIKNKEKYSKIAQSTRRINLVLVIDGSSLTAPYKAKVGEAFTKLNEILDNKKTAFEYTYGLVVYRDIVEKDCNGEDRSIESFPPSANHDGFIQKLDGISYGNCKDKDPSNQNLLDGLNKACSMFDGKSDESNFILVMGAGGDMRMNSKAIIDQIVAKVAANHVSVMSNQFYSSSEPGYQAFTRQIRDICQTAYSRVNAGFPNKSYPPVKFSKCRRNTSCVNYPAESALIAHLYNSVEGEQFSPEEFLGSIENSFLRIQNELEQILQEALNFLVDFESKGISPALCAKLTELNIPCSVLKDRKVSLMVDGYTRFNEPSLTEPPYSRCLFLTFQELLELQNFYRGITENSPTISEMRTNTYKAIYEYVRTFKGKKETDTKQAKKAMETMNGKDFIESVTGAPPSTENNVLRKIQKLSDIQNPQIVTDDDIDNLNKLIRNKMARMTQEKLNSCKFQNAEVDFYWLPVDWLP